MNHQNEVVRNKDQRLHQNQKSATSVLCASAQPVNKDVNMKVRTLVNAMTQEDTYMIKVGEKMYNGQRETASQHDNVGQITQGLGRLLILGRRVTPLKTMVKYINSQHFYHVIQAVKEVAGFDEKRNKFAKPTLATELGQRIQRVADNMEAEALSSQNNEKKQVVQEFRRMDSLSWNEMIPSAAYRTLEEKKWNKPKLIPLAEDVKKLHMYMTDKQKVPIILTPVMVESLELLVEERSSCGVGENICLFARPGFETRLRGADSIRELAKKCGTEKPEALSWTKLRKQVATLSRVLNLNDTEQDLLADFLGHDIRVHRNFYRFPEGTLQLAKISKVLMACEQGRLAEFKGKSLDQISISPNGKKLLIVREKLSAHILIHTYFI